MLFIQLQCHHVHKIYKKPDGGGYHTIAHHDVYPLTPLLSKMRAVSTNRTRPTLSLS